MGELQVRVGDIIKKGLSVWVGREDARKIAAPAINEVLEDLAVKAEALPFVDGDTQIIRLPGDTYMSLAGWIRHQKIGGHQE